MKETSKAANRRLAEGFYDRYLRGDGLDVGYGGDLVVPNARGWDVIDGDAQVLDDVPNESFDFVYSSHCLEHMRSPVEALLNWWRVLKPGGYLIVVIPDEDLYEHGIWPSIYNPDHRHTFTINKDVTWSPCSHNVTDLIKMLPDRKVLSIRTVDAGYDHGRHDDYDQTIGDAEAAIEFIVQKRIDDHELRSSAGELVRCPQCGHGRVGIIGVVSLVSLPVMCPICGWRGELQGRI